MSSVAGKAMALMRKGVNKGLNPIKAWNNALDHYHGESKEHAGTIYARFIESTFPDGSRTINSYSYARFVHTTDPRYAYQAYVDTTYAGHIDAHKVLEGIHAYCHGCGAEIWCDTDGKPRPQDRFELPGRVVFLCTTCQRQHVVRALLGE